MGYSIGLIVVNDGSVLLHAHPSGEQEEEGRRKNCATAWRWATDVTTIGGILGTVCAVKENSVVIETGADRVRIEMTKWAIGTKGSQTSPEPAPAKKEKKDEKK